MNQKQTKLQSREIKNTRHQLTIIKNCLKSIKIGQIPERQNEWVQQMYEGYLHSEEEELKLLGIECMTLMMIHNRGVFETQLRRVMDYIGEQASLKRKGPLSVLCIKGLFDCLMVHSFMIDQDNIQDLIR